MKFSRPLQLVHLYPKEMNIYGDTGNRIVLERRMQWRGIPYEVHYVSAGDDLPKVADIVIGGGGQDASQGLVEKDLKRKKSALLAYAETDVAMLMVCGMYQLLGRRFVTSEDREIRGLGILPIETIARNGRLIGNIATDVPGVGRVVGYENHSGRTYLDDGAQPLGKVVRGVGNNDESGEEGCRLGAIMGTYMHGPILSKNPHLADTLIALGLARQGRTEQLSALDDSLELEAQKRAQTRPR